MTLILVQLLGRLPLAAGLMGVWFAVEQNSHYCVLSRNSMVRRCGNCFLSAAGVPIELALLGLVVSAMCVLRIPYFRGRVTDWLLAAAGVVIPPMVVGVPLFASGLLFLLAPILRAA
jgi:hypothetical protein